MMTATAQATIEEELVWIVIRIAPQLSAKREEVLGWHLSAAMYTPQHPTQEVDNMSPLMLGAR
jgi:hypothetical protein